jgi:hypothetical protein
LQHEAQPNYQIKMKINRTTNSIAAATEILDWLNDRAERGIQDPVISLRDGDLLFYNAACGIQDDETVLVERAEQDSFGIGWDNAEATAEDVLAWIEDNCEPQEEEFEDN